MIKLRQLRCSFCSKKESEVLKLVAGPHAYICDECVAVANRIMSDSNGESPSTTPTERRTLGGRLRKLFSDWSARRVDYFSVG